MVDLLLSLFSNYCLLVANVVVVNNGISGKGTSVNSVQPGRSDESLFLSEEDAKLLYAGIWLLRRV